MADRMAKMAHKSPIGISTGLETWKAHRKNGLNCYKNTDEPKYSSPLELILGFSFRAVKAKSSNPRLSR
jgi:hypothetical protein